MHVNPRIAAPVVAGALALGGVASAAPAVAAGSGNASPATAQPAASGRYVVAHFTFYKNKKHPRHSKITWWWEINPRLTGGKIVKGHKSWRAASGNPPKSEDSCATNHGWLPNGWYDGLDHSKKWDGVIPPLHWKLSSHKCHNGTWRTELYIHTHTGWSSRANPWWTNGCIVLSPKAIKSADKYSRAHGGPGYTGKNFHHLLHVVGG